MEDFLSTLKDLQNLSISSLSPELAFWFGRMSSQSVSTSHFETLSQLNYYKNINLLTQAFQNFFILLLTCNNSRFSTIYSAFLESLNPDSIGQMLSESELKTFNQVYLVTERIEDPAIVEYPNENPYNEPQENLYNYHNNPQGNPYHGSQENPYYEDPYSGNFEVPRSDTDLMRYYQDLYGTVSQPEPEMECLICLEKFSLSEFVPLSNCACLFHTGCFNKFLVIEIQQRKFPIMCPGCKVELNEQDVVQRTDPDVQQNYFDFNFRKFVGEHSSDYSCCPTPDCKNVFIAGDENHFSCAICNKQYCLRCKTNFHVGMTCEQYQESEINKKTESADRVFMNFVKGTNYKQCPQCKFWVEKSSGCNHMVCRCKYEFCYACGGRYNHCECVKNARF